MTVISTNNYGQLTKSEEVFCTFVDDLKDSESRTKLATETVQALRTDGFTSLELIRLLIPDHITNIMQKAHNLPYTQVVALVNAVKQLQDCSAGHVLDKREYIENTLKKQPIFNLKQQAQEITQTSLQVKGIVNLNFSRVMYFLTSLVTNNSYWDNP